jgi:hypothetical protein
MYGWIYEYFHVNTVLMYSESYVQYIEGLNVIKKLYIRIYCTVI